MKPDLAKIFKPSGKMTGKGKPKGKNLGGKACY